MAAYRRDPGAIRFRILSGDTVDDARLTRLTSLFQKSFDVWPLSEPNVAPAEYLRWLLSGPENNMAVIAEEGSELVSGNIVILRRFLLCGKPIVVFDGMNSCVHPEHRGRAIFSARRKYQEREFRGKFRLELGFSKNPVILHHWSARNQHPPANTIQVLAKPLDALGLVRSDFGKNRLRRLAGPIVALLVWGLSRISMWRHRSSVPPGPQLEVQTLERFDKRVDRLFETASRQFDFIQVRDHHYLNWRYCDVRGGAFTVLGVAERQMLLGYLVFKIIRRRGYIADILCLPGRLDVVRCLVDEGVARMLPGPAAAVCWIPKSHPYQRMLRGLGFIDTCRTTGFTIRPSTLSAVEKRVFEDPRGALHLMPGDSDTI